MREICLPDGSRVLATTDLQERGLGRLNQTSFIKPEPLNRFASYLGITSLTEAEEFAEVLDECLRPQNWRAVREEYRDGPRIFLEPNIGKFGESPFVRVGPKEMFAATIANSVPFRQVLKRAIPAAAKLNSNGYLPHYQVMSAYDQQNPDNRIRPYVVIGASHEQKAQYYIEEDRQEVAVEVLERNSELIFPTTPLDEDQRELLAQLYTEERDTVFRQVYYRVGRFADAEDISEQAFLKVAEQLKGGRRKPIKPGFVHVAARNLGNDYHRRRAEGKVPISIDNPDMPYTVVSPDDIEAQILHAESGESLTQLLMMLKPVHRQVLFMRIVLNMSFADIALALNRSEGNIRVTLLRSERAAKKLAQKTGLLN